MGSLAALVAAFERGGSGLLHAQELRGLFLRHTDRITRRYPDAYFELGVRSADAVESLADRALAVCSSVKKGRFPFSNRAPFEAYVEEAFDDPPIRYHSFYARLAIARELLRDDYAFNLRRDPVLRWRSELHRRVGAVLSEHCDEVDGEKGGHKRWRPRHQGPSMVRDLDSVRQRLASEAPEKPLEVLVVRALTLAGRPLSHSILTNLMGDVLVGPAVDVPQEESTSTSLPEAMTVRQAVLGAWEPLEAHQKELVIALARGDSYDDLIARVDAFRDRSAVSRAVRACGEHFVGRIVADLGEDPTRGAATPKQVLELVAAVVLPMLTEEAS